jgi:hypothetical protein
MGMAGKDGRDGLDVKDLFRAEGGRLLAVMSDGTTKDLGVFVGADGKDGADGLGFDDMEPSYRDGEVTLAFRKGDREKSVTYQVPAMRHIGFWRDGMSAKSLETTTHDGSLWMALRETKAKPCHENNEDWILAARKGRDGDRGPAGKDYKPSEPVKLHD